MPIKILSLEEDTSLENICVIVENTLCILDDDATIIDYYDLSDGLSIPEKIQDDYADIPGDVIYIDTHHLYSADYSVEASELISEDDYYDKYESIYDDDDFDSKREADEANEERFENAFDKFTS